MFSVIQIPTLVFRILSREDGIDSPREAALCCDRRSKHFRLPLYGLDVYDDSLAADWADADRVSVAVSAAGIVFQKQHGVSEVHVRYVAEAMVPVRTTQLRHMSEAVVVRLIISFR